MQTVDSKTIDKNYKRAVVRSAKWFSQYKEDLRFALGDQWDDSDREVLKRQKRPAMTFNIILSQLNLIFGNQRQSRSAIKAYPEGGEDVLRSEIATRLIKNISKRSKFERKFSSQYEDGVIGGKSFLRPYMDYTYDLINGELKFKQLAPSSVKIDPDSVEYDLSDARYLTVETFVNKEELLSLFPKKKDIIETLQPQKKKNLEIESKELGMDYPAVSEMDEDTEDFEPEEYLLIEYFYKQNRTNYLAVNADSQEMQLFQTEEEAKNFLGELSDTKRVIPRNVPEFRIASMVENEILDDRVDDFYPYWKSFSIIPFFSYYSPTAKKELKREDLAYQGVVRALKDPQREKNKRRSQGLHIINTTANSGWLSEQGAWVDETMVKKFGAAPGVNLQYKKGAPKPERIFPTGAPAGQIMYEQESQEDIKRISGINSDMLAVEDKTTSGRAIALRQKQGFMMLQRIIDNAAHTKEIAGYFMLSQLSQLFTLEKAKKVLGESFINEIEKNMREMGLPERIEEVPFGQQNIVTAGQAADKLIQEVLEDSEKGIYDIAIGEGQDSPTVRYANFAMLMDLLQAGIQIPPNVIVEHSDLPESAKKEIQQQNAQNMQALQA